MTYSLCHRLEDNINEHVYMVNVNLKTRLDFGVFFIFIFNTDDCIIKKKKKKKKCLLWLNRNMNFSEYYHILVRIYK